MSLPASSSKYAGRNKPCPYMIIHHRHAASGNALFMV